MKKLLFILAAMLIATTALAQNEVGIYVVDNPSDTTAEEDACYMGPVGEFEIYCVLTDPFNENTNSSITPLGGFEFRVEWPADIFVTPVIDVSATNFQTPPDFLCGADIRVQRGMCTMITFTVAAMTMDPALWYITPISDPEVQTIPGGICVTDANDSFSISEAMPVSGSFTRPVFGMWFCVVDNEDVSFGDVKSLFR